MITEHYRKTFDEWEELPAAERRHRLVLHLGRQQIEREMMESSRRRQWDTEVSADAERDVRD